MWPIQTTAYVAPLLLYFYDMIKMAPYTQTDFLLHDPVKSEVIKTRTFVILNIKFLFGTTVSSFP